MDSSIRVGLIGWGFAGRTFHGPLLAATPGLQLAAVATRQHAVLQQDWQQHARLRGAPPPRVVADYEALARDPGVELVVIATPNTSHHPLARAALLAGKHVVVDKPFTVTLDEADDLVALARRQGRLLSVFHNRRWDGDFLSLRAAIAGGALGEVRELVSRFDRFDPVPRDRWRENAGPGSGLWIDLGPHLVDQALQLFGPPRDVTARIERLRDGAQADDFAQVVLGYPGRHVSLHCTRLAAQPGPRFEAHGTRGSFHCHGLDMQEDQLKAGLAPGDAGWGCDERPVWLTDGARTPREAQAQPRAAGAYGHYYAAVRDAIAGRAPNPVPPGEARRVMALVLLAARSAQERRTLDFDDAPAAV
jgi:predicted dehydrogenase